MVGLGLGIGGGLENTLLGGGQGVRKCSSGMHVVCGGGGGGGRGVENAVMGCGCGGLENSVVG